MFTLTYSAEVDWYRNVLATGRCTLLWYGGKYILGDPVKFETEAGLQVFPLLLRLVLRGMGIQNFFRMKAVE